MRFAREYSQLTKLMTPKDADIIDIVCQGLPLSALDEIVSVFKIDLDHAADLLGLTKIAIQLRDNKKKMQP